MGLPSGYELRAPTWDDLEPAAGVLAADDLDDAGQVVLVVDAANLTGATALYERLGMHVVKRFDVWERSLDLAAAAAPRTSAT